MTHTRMSEGELLTRVVVGEATGNAWGGVF